jgi:RNA polymerase sigma factor (sigma-70 family)
MSMDDELALLEAWRAGDVVAGDRLFRRHFDAVYWFFATKLDHGADDLAQDTFAAILRNREHVGRRHSFRAYLFAVARSKLIDRLRVRSRDFDPMVTSVVDLGTSPTSVLGRRQEQARLLSALRRIPVDLQLVLELFYVERLQGPEIAEALELPEGTVRSRLRRALTVLRELLLAEAGQDEAAPADDDIERWAAELRALRTG